jgi:hypothetical protein
VIATDNVFTVLMNNNTETICKWCETPIEQPDRRLGGMGWAHPDRYDVDCHGVECADGDNVAEPASP